MSTSYVTLIDRYGNKYSATRLENTDYIDYAGSPHSMINYIYYGLEDGRIVFPNHLGEFAIAGTNIVLAEI